MRDNLSVRPRPSILATVVASLILQSQVLLIESVSPTALTGAASGNILNASGFDGRTSLNGLAGNDTLTGGSDNDLLNPGTGVDSVIGNGGLDTLYPTENPVSNDTFNGGSGRDLLVDVVVSVPLTISDTQLTGYGTDGLTSFEVADFTRNIPGTLNGANFTGDLNLSGKTGIDTLIGGSGDDFIIGGDGNDVLDGNAGMDTFLTNSASNDVTLTNTSLTVQGVSTDSSPDFETAVIYGVSATQNYALSAFTGTVRVSDYGGNDTFTGNGMTILNVDGITPVTMNNTSLVASDRTLTYSGISSATVGLEGNANSTLNAGAFSKPLTVYSGDGNDTITTGRGRDFVQTAGGNDAVKTNRASDTIYTEEGKDTLNGGKGLDKCNGGPGSNTFNSCEKILKGDAPK